MKANAQSSKSEPKEDFAIDSSFGISQRVKDIMRNRGISVLELAEKTDVSNRQVEMLLSGRRRWHRDYLEKVSDYLNADFWYLLLGSEVIQEISGCKDLYFYMDGISSILKKSEGEELNKAVRKLFIWIGDFLKENK